MACAARMPLARESRKVVCACARSFSTVCVACAPVSVPFIFKADSAWSHGPCIGPAPWLALAMAPKKVSSIFSILASASFIGFSPRPMPWLMNCSSALRLASTAWSNAESMPARALPSMASTSIALDGFFAAPAVAAPATVLTTLRMLSRVSSRPCKALRVALATAVRSASPCLTLASSNIAMSASWSMPAFIMSWSSLHVLSAVDGDVGARDKCGLLRGQIDDEAGNLLGLAESTHRNLRQDLRVEDVFGNRRDHLRADVARRNGVDGDAFFRHLERERLGEAVHAGLGSGVVGLAERALRAVDR